MLTGFLFIIWSVDASSMPFDTPFFQKISVFPISFSAFELCLEEIFVWNSIQCGS